jgi:type II secretory pathway pseudopilin PulG
MNMHLAMNNYDHATALPSHPMRFQSASQSRHAITLIETLAVIALISLATVVLARGLLTKPPDHQLQRATQALVQIDATARSLARKHGPLSISYSRGVLLAQDASTITLAARPIPTGWSWSTSSHSGHPYLYTINTSGRSDDHQLLLVGPMAQHAVTVHGLIGIIRTEQAP